ncbi:MULTISPECIES: dihydrofolate reductase family protein [Nocardiaceae]|uniref:dihydrofolate reductase family protein n=1 Tax=Nocardiaceae TaxID=85025 RepID=UPI001E5429DF|nr:MULTISPECIES: dihydrofolate reductase family protein [Rhodococcus]MCC8927479.1 dihydrofolate reductase family protein [Rhodococcus sp. I2R]MCZ4275896.1 dihydrofolate reductase family protein [Rhodococcus yunnanensis]
MRELVYYVAVSLDGYIAAPDDSFDAFPMEGDHIDMIIRDYRDTLPSAALDALGLTPDLTRFDTVLMGWNTYAVGVPHPPNGPYAHLKQYVFSHRDIEVEPAVTLTDSDPVEVVKKLKQENGSSIWLAGGGVLASSLIDEIDRLILKVNPLLMGSGKRIFAERDYAPLASSLVASTSFASGVVVNEYTLR